MTDPRPDAEATPENPQALPDEIVGPGLYVRGALGGALMGLANLVPGISGGTMLLATGVYPAFIASIAEFTTLKWRLRSISLLAAVGVAAALAILLLAGPVKTLVVDHRWIMYSLFIGLTLGGLPLVWRLAKPVDGRVAAGGVGGFALMVAMAFGLGAGAGGGEAHGFLLVLAGLAGSSAMILPGVSGGYLLLLLGQYEAILGGIDLLKRGLLGDSATGAPADFGLVIDSMAIVIPVGIGVVVGIVGVSNLLKWLLDRHAKATLGVLLGLLLGAVVGLWPFQEGVRPEAGMEVRGQVLNAEEAAELEPEKWPLAFFEPSAGQIGGSLALIALGLGSTLAIDGLGRRLQRQRPADA